MSLLTRLFKRNNRSEMYFTGDQISQFCSFMLLKYEADNIVYTSKLLRKNAIEFRMYFRKNKKITFSIRNGVVKILDDNTFKDFTHKELQKDWDKFVEYVRRDLDYTITQNSKQKDQSVENEETKNI